MSKKEVLIKVAIVIGTALVASATTAIIFCFVLDNKDKEVAEVPAHVVTNEVEQAEVKNEDTGEVKTYVTGGTATIATTSGESIPVTISNTMYNISDNYLSIIAEGFGSDTEVKAPNTVITGDKPSITESLTSINAAPFSDIFGIYTQIFGAEYVGEDESVIWSPAYTKLVTGEFPEELPDNYVCNDSVTFEKDGITWTCFDVSFTTDYTNYYDEDGNELAEEDVVKNIIPTQQLACYSDTEDPVEILVYSEDNNVDTEVAMLKEFLQVK